MNISLIETHLNDAPAGPNNSIPTYIAYIDPERDAGIYGYGDTEAEAVGDYLRNSAERYCSDGCDCACDAVDCVLNEPNLSNYISRHVSTWLHDRLHSTHQEWIKMNGDPP